MINIKMFRYVELCLTIISELDDIIHDEKIDISAIDALNEEKLLIESTVREENPECIIQISVWIRIIDSMINRARDLS